MAANGSTDVEANATLDARIEAGTVVDLVTVMGTATAAGTAASGGSYTPATPTWASAAARAKANSASVSYGPMAALTVVGVDLKHSAGAGGARSYFAPFTSSKVLNAGDLVIFAVGALSISFVNGT